MVNNLDTGCQNGLVPIFHIGSGLGVLPTINMQSSTVDGRQCPPKKQRNTIVEVN
jgi:hypothetical protein